MLYVSTTREGR